MLPVVHDRHPVAELVRLFHVVGGEQDGLSLAVELAEQLPQGEPALGVEPRGGLVHEQHRRRWKMARATISRWAMPPRSA